MKNEVWKSRLSKITALGMSLVIALNPMMVYAEAGMESVSAASAASVSPGDVSPGDNSRNLYDDATPRMRAARADVTPGDAQNTIDTIFPDDNLAASIARELAKDVSDEVSQIELDTIYGITVSEVMDWAGIERLSNFFDIHILPTTGYDLSYLAGLNNVTALEIWIEEQAVNTPNGLTGDIGVFSDFTDLRKLSIGENIEIYGSLSSLPDTLTDLWLPYQTTDIGIEGTLNDLTKMTELQAFSLSGNGVGGSLVTLVDLPMLTSVSLSKTSVTGSLSDLTDMTELTLLWLTETNSITGSLSDISDLKKLTQLSLFSNNSTTSDITGNIQVLRDFTDLEYLELNGLPKVTGDISNLAGLINLYDLNLNNTSVYGDTSSISGLTLSSINIADTQVEGDVSDFAAMPLKHFFANNSLLTGNLFDLGLKSDLTDINIRKNMIRVDPEDTNLFPNLVTEDDIFVQPVIDTVNSNLTYRLGFSYEDENRLYIRTNKTGEGFAKLLIDGAEVPMLQGDSYNYNIGHEVDDQTNEITGELYIWQAYLEQLSAGEHTVTLDFYWGGEVSTTFTVAETFYTVQFLGVNDKLLKEQRVSHGKPALEPNNFLAEGYTFQGWDTDFSEVTSDLFIRAIYKPYTYQVTFKDWDGIVLKTQTVDYNGAAQAPEAPARRGYKFTGWNAAFDNITANLTVTAVYEENTFTVTFQDYDGRVLDQQTNIPYGMPATAPADPVRQGYEFIGWDKGFGEVTEDLTVTAAYIVVSDNTYIIDKPGIVDGEILNQYDNIIIRSSGVIIDGGKIRGNIRVEAENVILRNLDIAGKVYLLAKETTITDSIIRGSFTVSAESIVMKNLDIRGNLSIGATNITLTDSEVRGNVTIERSVGNGHVEFTNVKSKGNIMYVKGGGSNSVVLTNSEIGAIVIEKLAEAGQQAVRVAVQGTTRVANTIVNSAAIIEDTTSGSGMQNVMLSARIPANTTIELRGSINEVTVQKAALKVVNNAAVEKIQVEAPSLTLINNSTVSELKVEEYVTDTKVEGGKIDNVVVADGAELPVYVERPQVGTDSGNDDDMDGAAHTFLPKGADGKANPYGKVSVYDDVLLADGVKAKARLLPITEALKAAANEFAKTQDTPNTPFAYVDVVVDGYKSGKATVKFNLYDIYENDTILVFHQKTDGTWECIIPDKIENGAVTVTFTSLSPVVFSKAGDAAGNAKVTSPKTSDNSVAAMAVLCVLGICAGLGYLQYSRRKYR